MLNSGNSSLLQILGINHTSDMSKVPIKQGVETQNNTQQVASTNADLSDFSLIFQQATIPIKPSSEAMPENMIAALTGKNSPFQATTGEFFEGKGVEHVGIEQIIFEEKFDNNDERLNSYLSHHQTEDINDSMHTYLLNSDDEFDLPIFSQLKGISDFKFKGPFIEVSNVALQVDSSGDSSGQSLEASLLKPSTLKSADAQLSVEENLLFQLNSKNKDSAIHNEQSKTVREAAKAEVATEDLELVEQVKISHTEQNKAFSSDKVESSFFKKEIVGEGKISLRELMVRDKKLELVNEENAVDKIKDKKVSPDDLESVVARINNKVSASGKGNISNEEEFQLLKAKQIISSKISLIGEGSRINSVESSSTQNSQQSTSMITPIANELHLTSELNAPQKLTPTSEFVSPLSVKQSFTPNLAMRVQWMFNQALAGAEILMDPPEMGPLSVKVQQTNGETNILFQVSNTATKDLLDENLSKLKEMLAESGVNIGEATVEQHERQAQSQSESSNVNQNSADTKGDGSNEDEEGTIVSATTDRLVDLYS
ncbi:flagellar hook-length control protein FliK [Aliikangiella sp. IMCC44359]|uniref:flagellar hook-length control protein FliK n=1 Tax=Aliikangiella sp. IMCC44359 TaxID=3459125 RepID=UPI00403A9724